MVQLARTLLLAGGRGLRPDHPSSFTTTPRQPARRAPATMLGLKNALKGVQYANPALGERLYELCRKATSRHIDRPDEIINQQVRVCGVSRYAQRCTLTVPAVWPGWVSGARLCCFWRIAWYTCFHTQLPLVGCMHLSLLNGLLLLCPAAVHTPTTGGVHDQQRHARLRGSTGGWWC